MGTANFENFAKEYLQKFKFSTVSSGEFRDFFLSKFSAVPAVTSLEWDKYFYGQGMPPMAVDFSNPFQDEAERLAKQWIEANANDSFPDGVGVGGKDIKNWDSQQTCIFLGELLEESKKNRPLSLQTLRALDNAYCFTAVVNSEIKYCWQMLCLLSEDKDIVPHVVSFITTQGRMKFVRPLYRALFDSAVGSKTASQTFIAKNQMYHPICRKMVASDLRLDLDALNNTKPRVSNKPLPASPPVQKDETAHYFPMVAALLGGAAYVAYHNYKNR